MTSHSRLNLIQVDTREKSNDFIEQYLDEVGIPFYRSKLFVGDYIYQCSPYFVVDRKKNMSELYGNITTQHKRFREECKRATDCGIHLVILIEDEDLRTLEDVKKWKNPQRKYSKKALDGNEIYKRLDTMRIRYDIEFQFCTHDQYAKTVIALLTEARDKWLSGIAMSYGVYNE